MHADIARPLFLAPIPTVFFASFIAFATVSLNLRRPDMRPSPNDLVADKLSRDQLSPPRAR